MNIQFKSQIGQDRYYIEEYLGYNKVQKGGMYLDIGCNDGVTESNTYVLDHMFGWKGVLIDANPTKVKEAMINRPGNEVIQAVLWNCVDEIQFEYPGLQGEGNSLLARIRGLHRNSKYFREDFENSRVYWTQTTTLSNLLIQNFYFDYVSIDVEGSELECLRGVDWNRFYFGFMTIEWGMRSEYLNELTQFMISKGYRLHRINYHDAEFIPQEVEDPWQTSERVLKE